MLTQKQKEELQSLLGVDRIHYNYELKDFTSFKIGGPADVLVQPESEPELLGILAFCRGHRIPWFVLGKGTNLIIRDKGIRGMVIILDGELTRVQVCGNRLTAGGGALLADASAQAARAGLTGMEFAQGIPGSVGGAVMMNAGAYGGEMKDIVEEVQAVGSDGSWMSISGEDMNFGYRMCRLQGMDVIVTRVIMNLRLGEQEAIRARTEELQRRRWDKQPLDLPSAGSVFRRPEGYYAGALIEEAGLKGFQIGGARVSDKHAGFIVNTGQATAADVLALILHIQHTVLEKSGVHLETEVRVVGEE